MEHSARVRSASGFGALLPTTAFDGPSPVAVSNSTCPRRSLRKWGEKGRMFDLRRQPAGSRGLWCRILDEHHLRSPGKLVVRNLDRIAHIDNIRNQRPCKTVQLLAPTMVSENWCERRHLRLTLGSIKSLVLHEI